MSETSGDPDHSFPSRLPPRRIGASHVASCSQLEGHRQMDKGQLPFPSIPFFHFLTFSPFPFPSLPLRSRSPEIQVGGLGYGRRPSRNRTWCILAFESHCWWQQF